jgi:NAD(P)-dependent dehydrogenase (short-subunit alcohol dehydrogenase family)
VKGTATVSPATRPCRSVALTAAGNGLGRAIALGFAAKRCIVFGTAASAEEAQELRASSGGRVSLTVCDITKPEAVRAWAGGVSDAVGEAGIDVLINISGGGTAGPVELLTLAAVRHDFDVNVFSVVSVVNSMLPALKKAHGLVLQILPEVIGPGLPFNGVSEASKAAVEAVCSAYRAELAPFGVDVTVAASEVLGAHGLKDFDVALARLLSVMAPRERKRYGKPFGKLANHLTDFRLTEDAFAPGAAQVIDITEHRPAPARIFLGMGLRETALSGSETSVAVLEATLTHLAGLS